MKTNRLFLTSSMIMAIATFPAIADNVYNDDIAGQCVVGFLGGTGADNSTAPNSFQAQYDANEYDIPAGQYLKANEIAGTQCPANSYCPGDTYTFSETNDQGIESCPSGFTLSAVGSSAQTDCYRTCTTNDVAHSATVSGGFYYGNNNQCVPESCVTGYHVYAPLANIGEIQKYAYRGNGTINGDNSSYSAKDYGLKNGEFVLVTSNGTVYGQALCSVTNGVFAQSGTPDESGTGQYCWCKITGYTPTDGTMQNIPSSWLFGSKFSDGDSCHFDCAEYCAPKAQGNEYSGFEFHDALFSSAPSSCVANEINVNWYNGETLYETNQCTYDGAITLPTAPEKTGYTFTGWKLVTGSSN